MKPLIFFFIFVASSLCMNAQEKKLTGHFTGPFSAPLIASNNTQDLLKTNWEISFQSLYKKNKTDIFHTKALKNKKMEDKIKAIRAQNFNQPLQKTTANNPTIGTNFKGNELKTWTPTDNSIAVSNSGYIVSCVNYGIEFYDTVGTSLLQNQTWSSFIPDTSLNSAKYDPRVLYDNIHQRFIVVLLHGFSSVSSKILICFSKTDNPMDGWNFYALSGNPYLENAWTDFPTIGVSNDDLFINGNRFGDAPNYDWKGTYIYQIGLSEGYTGSPIQFGLWNQIVAPNGEEGITLYPAMNGQGNSMSEKMYFVHLRPDSGSNVYLYEINGKLQSSSKTLTATSFSIPHYEVCANALQKDQTTGFLDSLSTGSAWTQNAFSLNRNIHFTYTAETQNGFCGIHYGRILLDSNKVLTSSYGVAGSDLAYPAIASLGYDSLDQNVGIAFLRSDSTITPETGIVTIDNDMVWSTMQTVKAGDTMVNILYPPAYAIQPERWGDYTGINRKYNSAIPQVWMAGAYGANTLPRRASYGTWIAQIKTNDAPFTPVAIEPIVAKNETVNIFPNPAKDIFSVEFDNQKAGNVRIELFSMNGQLIKVLFDDYLNPSLCRISFNKFMLIPGNYLVSITRNNQFLSSHKVVIQ